MGDERRSGPTRSTYAVIWDVDGMLRKNLVQWPRTTLGTS
jgi:hypothetical protein